MSIPSHIGTHITKLYEASKYELGEYTDDRIKKFKTILRIYYPWAKKDEANNMLALIYNKEAEYQNGYWKEKITKTHKYDILTLFGNIDKDFNNKIDIDEFISAFNSATNYDEKTLRKLFIEADSDKNGILDILEFIELLSRHHMLREELETVLLAQKQINNNRKIKRLSVLFKNVPNSPTSNWRPSLSALHSPSTINRILRQSS